MSILLFIFNIAGCSAFHPPRSLTASNPRGRNKRKHHDRNYHYSDYGYNYTLPFFIHNLSPLTKAHSVSMPCRYVINCCAVRPDMPPWLSSHLLASAASSFSSIFIPARFASSTTIWKYSFWLGFE